MLWCHVSPTRVFVFLAARSSTCPNLVRSSVESMSLLLTLSPSPKTQGRRCQLYCLRPTPTAARQQGPQERRKSWCVCGCCCCCLLHESLPWPPSKQGTGHACPFGHSARILLCMLNSARLSPALLFLYPIPELIPSVNPHVTGVARSARSTNAGTRRRSNACNGEYLCSMYIEADLFICYTDRDDPLACKK